MDPNEVFEYVTEGMKWLAVGGGTYIAYLTTLAGLTGTKAAFSQRIRTQEELGSVVSEEAKRLGIDAPIEATLLNKQTAQCRRTGECYELQVGGFCAKRSAVKHELYHIHKGDCDRRYGSKWIRRLSYQFIEEPRAILYDTFGIKL